MSLPGSVDDLEDANEQESPSSTEDQTDAVLTLEKVAKYHRGKWDMVLLQVHAYNTALMAEAAAAVEQLTPEMAAAGTELLAGMQEPLLTLSLALCAAKRGTGGRTSEPDPATDKRIDPMTAKRIMDKRRTAALSKFKQKVASLAEVAMGAGLMTGAPLNPDGALARQPGSGAADPALAAVAAAATAAAAAAAAAGGGTAWGIRNGLALSQPSSPTVAERAAAAAALWSGERSSRAPVRRARSFYAGSTSRGPAAAAAADAGRNLRMRASLIAEAADWAVGDQFKKRSQGQLQQVQEGKQQAGPARAQRSVKRQKSQQVLGSSPSREVSNREDPARSARSASPLLEVPHNCEAALDEDQQAWQQQAWQQQAFQLQGLDGFSGEGGQPYGMPANGLEPGCAGAATAGPGDMGFQDVYTRVAAVKHAEGEPTSAAAGAAAAACNAAGAEDSMLPNMQQADGDADGDWLLQEFGVPGSPTLADLLMFDSPTESPKAGNSNPTPAGWAPSNPQGQQLQQEGSGLAARSSAMMPAHTAGAGGASAATRAPGAGLSGHVAAQHTSRSQSAGTACAGADAGIAAAGYLEQQAAVLTDVQSGMQGMHIMGSAAGAVPEPEQRMGVMPAQQDQGTACWPQQRMGAQQVRDAIYVLQQDSALPARQVQGANCIVRQSAACRPQHFMGGIPAPQEHGATDVLQHEPAMHALERTAYVRGRPALQLPAGDPMTAGGMVSPATSSAGASAHAPRALQLASLLAGGAWQQQDSRVRNNSPAQLLAGSGSRASPNTDNSSGHSSAAVLPVDVAASMAAIQTHGQLLPDQLAQRLLQGTQQQAMQGPRWSGVTADTLMAAMPMLGQGAGMQQAGASTSTEMAGKFGTAGLAEQQARNRNAGGSAHPHADMHAGLQGYQGTGLAQHGSTAFGADAAGIAGRGFGALAFTTTTPAAGSTANSSGSISGAGGRGADGLSDMMRGAMASCGLQPAVLNSRRPVQHHASTGDLTQVSHVNKLQQQVMQQQQELQAAAAALQEQLSATAGRARPALSEGMLGQGLSCRITRDGSMPGDMPAGNLLGMGAPGSGLNLTGQVAASGSMGGLGVLREGLQADQVAHGRSTRTGAVGRPAARASPFQTMQESSASAASASLLQVAALLDQTEPVTPAVSSLISYVADMIRSSNGHITAAVNSALPVLTAAASGGCEIGPVLKRLRITLLEAHLQAQRAQLMASMDNLSVAEQDRLAMETAELASALVSIARLDSMGAAAPLQPAGSTTQQAGLRSAQVRTSHTR